MNRPSGLVARPDFSQVRGSAAEKQERITELDDMVQTIVHSLAGEVGLLTHHSPDDITPTLVASNGLPDPGFALTAIDDAVRQHNGTRLNGHPGSELTDLTILADHEDRSYFLMQMSTIAEDRSFFSLAVGRSAENGPFLGREKQAAQGLFALFYKNLEAMRNRASAAGPADFLVYALELWDIGILLIDHRLKVILANAAATAILDKGDGLRKIGNSLGADRLDDTARLQSAILFSVQASLEDRIKADMPKIPVVAIERRGNRRPLIVSVAPIPSIASSAGHPAAVVYIVDPDRDMHDSIGAICQTYGLTNVEAELTSNLVLGLTVAQTARKMHIQANTARSYLKQIFQKTMTNRQADLVRIILASSFNPVKNVRLSPLQAGRASAAELP